MRELVRRFERYGPPVRLDLPDDGSPWPPEVAGTVHRVVQESLTNISRHAPQAGEVAVSVRQDGAAVHVRVADDGPPGGRAVRRGGFGLIGMRERVESLGGTFRAGPRDGAGWSVAASLPVAGD